MGLKQWDQSNLMGGLMKGYEQRWHDDTSAVWQMGGCGVDLGANSGDVLAVQQIGNGQLLMGALGWPRQRIQIETS